MIKGAGSNVLTTGKCDPCTGSNAAHFISSFSFVHFILFHTLDGLYTFRKPFGIVYVIFNFRIANNQIKEKNYIL